MRKAKLSVHIADVKQVIKVFGVEVSASTHHDLNEEKIILTLKKASGANYDRQGSNCKFSRYFAVLNFSV